MRKHERNPFRRARVAALLGAAVAFALIAGCGSNQTVSENQCIASDWQTLGYRDGVNGYRSTRLLEHQEACVEHGIIPDRGGYMIGWEQGAREYCQPDNGFAVGERGWRYDNHCPRDLHDAFLDAYEHGRELYIARAEVSRLERAIAEREQRLVVIKNTLISSATEQLNPALTPQQRVEMLTAAQQLTDEKRRIRKELPGLRRDLAERSARLDDLQGHIAAR